MRRRPMPSPIIGSGTMRGSPMSPWSNGPVGVTDTASFLSAAQKPESRQSSPSFPTSSNWLNRSGFSAEYPARALT